MGHDLSHSRRSHSQTLSTGGDGTGTVNANVDGTTPVEFKLTCPAGVTYELNRMLVYIEDAGVLLSSKYGAIDTLTNGVLVEVHDSTGTATGQLGHEFHSNAHWAKVCHDSIPHDYGSGNNSVSVRWTFSRSGEPIFLGVGESLVVTVQDDLTGLVEHTFIAGFVEVR